MARVTVEDCIKVVNNRFELVLIAAVRSRQLASGQGRSILVDREDDRNPVVALREIADGKIKTEELHEKIITDSLRRMQTEDEPNENVDMSEEDMLKQLEALEAENNEMDFNVDDSDDELIGLDESEEVGEMMGEATPEDENIGDEIGAAAAEDSFFPQEANDEEEDLIAEIEEDGEMIGEAIEDSPEE